MTATLPPLTEKQFQRQVTELAEIRGYVWVHFRPAQTKKGWRTPVSGPLGKGWPDLVLIRQTDRRCLFVELKADGKQPKPDQEWVLNVLRTLEHYPVPMDDFLKQKGPLTHPSIEVYVWHPSDWDFIQRKLR